MLSEDEGILNSGVIKILAARIKEKFDILGYPIAVQHRNYYPSLEEITCGAALAHHGLLGPVNFLRLGDVDLSRVPTQHLVSLVSSVTKVVTIHYVIGCDLVTLIDSLKCTKVKIGSQSLGMEETQALVRVMESRVEKVDLEYDVTLDIEALAEYSGQGCCSHICRSQKYCSDKLFDKHSAWARRKNWRMSLDFQEFVGTSYKSVGLSLTLYRVTLPL